MTDSKLILTDADGVLFDWRKGFLSWIETKGLTRIPGTEHHYTIEQWYGISKDEAWGYVTEFNFSNELARLEPFIDSVEYIRKLHEDGYKIVVITAMGMDDLAAEYRARNLEEAFGDIFEQLIVVDLLTSKIDELKAHPPAIWVEDKPSNAEEGLACGHRTYLIEHGHNGHLATSKEITRVTSWKEIYNSIESEKERAIPTPF